MRQDEADRGEAPGEADLGAVGGVAPAEAGECRAAAPMRSCGWPAVFRPGGPAAAVAFVQAHREEFGVAPLCRICGMPVSTFYDRVGRPVSARALAYAELAEKIEKIWADSGCSYGSTRSHAAVRRG